jgi:hypothetical protein
MARLFEIAAQIATPLALSGVVVIVIFVLYQKLIAGPLSTQLSRSHNFRVINRLVTFLFILGLVAIIIGVGSFLVVKFMPAPTAEEPAPIGFLSPGNTPTPPNPCGPLKPGDFVLLAGGSAFHMSKEQRHMTVVRMQGKPLVWIDYDDQGVYVSANLARADGRTVAVLRHNQFEVNTNNYYKLKRPNRHELTVIDMSGTTVLHAEFLNEQVFRIQGHFVQPGYGTLTLKANDFALSNPGWGFFMRHGCLSEWSIAFDS